MYNSATKPWFLEGLLLGGWDDIGICLWDVNYAESWLMVDISYHIYPYIVEYEWDISGIPDLSGDCSPMMREWNSWDSHDSPLLLMGHLLWEYRFHFWVSGIPEISKHVRPIAAPNFSCLAITSRFPPIEQSSSVIFCRFLIGILVFVVLSPGTTHFPISTPSHPISCWLREVY